MTSFDGSSSEQPSDGTPSWRSLFPFTSRYLMLDGYRLHYVDEGHGPVLIFLHACPLWSFSFRDQIASLSKDHRVIAFDQMGFGLSDKPRDYDYRIETHITNLARLITHLELKNVTFIMQGRGASIGIGYAVRIPDNVCGFITLNTMAFTEFKLPWRIRLTRLLPQPLRNKVRLFFLNRGRKHFSPEVRAAYEYPFRNRHKLTALVRFVEDLPCVPEDDSAQSMYEIEAGLWVLRDKPACILWAKHDWLYGKRNLKKWHLYFPDAEVHMIDRAGRYASEDAPGEISSYVRDFLSRNKL